MPLPCEHLYSHDNHFWLFGLCCRSVNELYVIQHLEFNEKQERLCCHGSGQHLVFLNVILKVQIKLMLLKPVGTYLERQHTVTMCLIWQESANEMTNLAPDMGQYLQCSIDHTTLKEKTHGTL